MQNLPISHQISGYLNCFAFFGSGNTKNTVEINNTKYFSKILTFLRRKYFEKVKKSTLLSLCQDLRSNLLIVQSLIKDFNEKDLSFGRKVALFSCLHRS